MGEHLGFKSIKSTYGAGDGLGGSEKKGLLSLTNITPRRLHPRYI